MRTTAILGLLALAGCATQPETIWVHPEASQQRYDMDTGQCRAQAFGISQVSLTQAVIVYESCLQGKGWYKQPAR